MAARVYPNKRKGLVIKDGYRVMEEYNKITVYDVESSQVTRYL
jgi:hypothetical protein